jgi:hypothetical protein
VYCEAERALSASPADFRSSVILCRLLGTGFQGLDCSAHFVNVVELLDSFSLSEGHERGQFGVPI